MEDFDHDVAELLRRASALQRATDLTGAQRALEHAVALTQEAGDTRTLARVQAELARVIYKQDDYAAALTLALRAQAAGRETGNLAAAALAGETIGHVLLGQGDTQAALVEALAALEAAEASADDFALYVTLGVLSMVYTALQQWDKAVALVEREGEVARRLDDAYIQAMTLAHMAHIAGWAADDAHRRADHAAAARWDRQSIDGGRLALVKARGCGSRFAEIYATANLAQALAARGAHGEALELLDAWQPDPAHDQRRMIASLLEARAGVLEGLGRDDEAAAMYEQALLASVHAHARMNNHRALAALLERTGDLRGALDHQKRVQGLFEELVSERAQRSAAVAAVRLETERAKAHAAFEQARAEQLEHANLNLARRSEDLHRQAFEDALTGLPNRRRLDELLALDIRDHAVILIDLDHFKQVNDRHSHLVGDRVLRELAQLLRASSRESDMPARFGGEEFALMLHAAPMATALAIAERARAAVQAHDWERLSPGLAVTASFGVALGVEAESAADMLALADRRLYAAKRSGRNRVVGHG